jgi:hypothetical protein
MNNRWIELSFIEDIKSLKKYGLVEYYNKSNTGLYEFLNPELSYNYQEVNMSDGQKMWKIDKQSDDPILVVTLKKLDLAWILDFYFPETEEGFGKPEQGLTGTNYLDTIAKIVKDEVIPYFMLSPLNTLYFHAYSADGGGEMRANLFKRLINKYVPKKEFKIDIMDLSFRINKIKK